MADLVIGVLLWVLAVVPTLVAFHELHFRDPAPARDASSPEIRP